MLAIYTRLSKEDEHSTSIINQLREGKDFASRAGFADFEIYNEGEGVSGTLDIEERPQFKRLLDDIIAGKLEAVWFRNNNRVERNSLTFHVFLDACKKSQTKIFIADKEFDYNNPNELLAGSILSLLNGYSAQLQSVQTQKVLKNRIKDGKAHGVLPYGYTRDKNQYLIVDEEEAEIVKEIYRLSLSGKGQQSIAEYLNDRKIPTRYAKYGKGTITTVNKYTGKETVKDKKEVKWAAKTIQGIIKNTIYKGVRVFKGEDYEAPEIVEPSYWQKVNDNLKKNANTKTGRRTKHKYLLKGLIRCGRCQRNYYGRTRTNKKDHFYMCSSKRIKGESCGQSSINIDVLENIVFDELFMHPENIQTIYEKFNVENEGDTTYLKNDLKFNKGKVKDLRKQIDNALNYILKGSQVDKMEKKINSIDNQIIQVEKEIEDLETRIENVNKKEKKINDFKDLMAGVGHTFSYQQIKDLTHSLVKNIVLTHHEKKDSWDVEIEFETGHKIMSGTTDKKMYRAMLEWKPFYEKFDKIVDEAAKPIEEEELLKLLSNKKEGIFEETLKKMHKKAKEEGFNISTPWKPDDDNEGSGGANSAPRNNSTGIFNTTSSTKNPEFTNTTITDVALVGGGAYPQPGEISLSHNGVLFLDELPEFKRGVLEVMRQPLEDREVTISRAKFSVTYPSSFMLVASMNPSPSGYFNDPTAPVTSSPAEMQRYLSKISGPLLDRIDIHIEVTPVPFEKLSESRNGESSLEIRKRVARAREVQTKRFSEFNNIHYNAQMGTRQIRFFCVLDEASKALLKTAMEKLNLSARAYDRILKVARTIADLDEKEQISGNHIAEAIQYRSLDREGWLG